ncbi:hypothetical protein BDZ91DRAFT_765982 [Kalaharituber pfeilii]|nr:hypothetical protein BDZ91DRAFT_765982 [Kalaharituber pfeilii]
MSYIGSTGALLTAPQYRREESSSQSEHKNPSQASTYSLRDTASQLSDAHLNLEPKTTPTYPALTIKTVLFRTTPIILCNLFSEGRFAYTLKVYNDKGVLGKVDRRWFNTISLLLAAALSMGIGYFLDQVGLMLRGGLVMKRPNTTTEIGHIWRGTIGSYSLLVWCHLRRKSYNVVTVLAWLFVVGNVIGRLSVAFLGLTYTVDDDELVEVKAIEGAWWPEVGEKFANDSVFASKVVSSDTLLELLREAAIQTQSAKNTSLAVSDSGDPFIKNLEYFLDVPGLVLSIDGHGTSSKVSYSYILEDEGGDKRIKIDRSIQVAANCTEVKVFDEFFVRMNYSTSIFYPVQQLNAVNWNSYNYTEIQKGTYTSLPWGPEGWVIFSEPGNGTNCGLACTMMGLAEGFTHENDPLTASFVRNGYNCQITVEYCSPVPWGNRIRVAPSEALRKTLSRFLVADGRREVSYTYSRAKWAKLLTNSLVNNTNIATDQLWLPKWRDRLLPNDPGPPTQGIAGVLARSVALVVQRMGNGLRKEEIVPSRPLAVGVLLVDWHRVVLVLAGMAVFQMMVAVFMGWFVLGTLEVRDDVETAARILANLEKEEACGEPWTLVRVDGKGVLRYRFTGDVTGARKA